MNKIQIRLPKKISKIFTDKVRYRGAYGGRGSGKSFGFALMCAVYGTQRPIRILCARELQNSIKDSVHHEIVRAIETNEWLYEQYDTGVNYIRGKNGTEFLFKGLRHNYRDIKSTSGINICWIEEAETVSEESWRVLIPTIREPRSEIWLTWNPESEDSSTNKRYIIDPPENSIIEKVNYCDNPWFPDELEQERIRDKRLDPDLYQHIWEGECITRSDAQVFSGKWVVRDFEEPRDISGGPYYGSDFGFSIDPTTLVRCFIVDNTLYISHEVGGVGVDLDETAKLYSDVPDYDKYVIRADSARPETISYLKKNNHLRMEPVKKWSGSVEDGVSHIRSYDQVVIHPRCKNTAKEFRLYSYKIDRLSGDVMRDIVDANNHYIDAIRYALDPMIKAKMTMFEALTERKRRIV
jgi:phage terminase large subunit